MYAHRGLVVITGPTERQVKHIVMGEVRRAFERAADLPGDLFELALRIPATESTGIVAFTSTDSSQLTGFHAPRLMVIVTEAQGISTKPGGPMFMRIGLSLLLASVSVQMIQAQQKPSADSLITYWLKRGAIANWQPNALLEGCPNLKDWQRRGIERLLAADLSPERTNDLARAWMFPLKGCQDSRLEQWYFRHIDAAIQRGEPEGKMMTFWLALQHGDSPGIRDYTRSLMLDIGKPEPYRNAAGGTLFVRFTPEERLTEYLRAFDTRRMPFEIAVGQTELLLKQNPEGLLREVGSRIRSNPELADQIAFTGIVESSPRYASLGARRRLGEALEAGLTRAGLTDKERSRLEGSARFLKQQGT